MPDHHRCSTTGRADAAGSARPPPAGARPVPRRRALGAALAGALGAAPARARAAPLAPLGGVEAVGGPKRTGLPVEEVAKVLEADLQDRQYFVTGRLTPEIFADDCRFKDPTNDVVGLSRYLAALRVLFDPERSAVNLDYINVTGDQEITASWRLGGYLKFPWRPYVQPFRGVAVYTLRDGLIVRQEEEWEVTPLAALLESFTPTNGADESWREIRKA